MSTSSKNFYIPGLDPLRAVAAVSVAVTHIEQIKTTNGLPNASDLPFFVHTGGHIGVVLFFVLSGFLITLLLLRELESTGRISYKDFYARRILRIWPLYYFILIATAVLWSYQPSWLTALLCFTILPNVAHVADIGWVPSPPVWSIGVEEQFYLVWPLVVFLFRKSLLPLLMV
ncbi:MAG TPA: acyltransferase, partial [Chitinophagales bacterium]|nr:acyltransferase [Chitinophagales bacterium]